MKTSILLFCVLLSTQLSSQTKNISEARHIEGGILLGISNYSGDISEKGIQISESKPAYGIFCRYFLSNRFSLRAHIYGGVISGEDAHSKDLWQQQRSFRFKTELFELGLGGEFHIFGKGGASNMKGDNYILSPYLYLGIGGTLSRKKVGYYGAPENRDEFEIVPLPEGGGHQQFLVFPMGIGVRAEITKAMVLGLELGFRPSVSDQLDGVSLNGNPDKKDWYYFGGATLAFNLFNQNKIRNPTL